VHYLLCRQVVSDYAKWRRVFDSHAEAQRESGLHLVHVLRDVADPSVVVVFFKVDDVGRARAFTEAPAAHEAAESSGVIGVPEVSLLTE
jgi:hypothetical protein